MGREGGREGGMKGTEGVGGREEQRQGGREEGKKNIKYTDVTATHAW